jgi:predicted O-methyltransferase YrrM
MYQPLARIIHYGSVTAGLDSTGPLRKYLLINKEKFLNRWNKQLLGHTTSSVAAGKCLQSADRRLAHRSHSITPLAIKEKVVGIPHMSYAQGAKITDIIIANKFTSVLELGFRHGVSTCYMAGALSVLGEGHITTIDLACARNASPNIEQLLASLGLSSFVTIYYEPTSYIWRLMKMLETVPQPQFDFCYLDGAHNWATDGFAFFLVDKLLKPGGLIVFDDLDWTYNASPSLKETESVKKMPHDERSTPQIRKVFELLVKTHPAYEKFKEEGNWAYAWKRN